MLLIVRVGLDLLARLSQLFFLMGRRFVRLSQS
jgi:hypothetical protein